MYDLQKASMSKRIAAWIFDLIIIVIVMVGLACAFSAVFQYDEHCARVRDGYASYEAEYGVDFSLPNEEYSKLAPEEQQKYIDANAAMQQDVNLRAGYNVVVNLSLLIIMLSVVIGFVAMELVVPLWLGNGQTFGKKIFGIGVVRVDCVRVTTMQMFARAILGKCTLETMLPVFIIVMIVLGKTDIVGLAVLAALFLSQAVMLIATKERLLLHDMMAGTVTVDLASQMIFESPEELLAYKQRIHAEIVSDAKEHARYTD